MKRRKIVAFVGSVDAKNEEGRNAAALRIMWDFDDCASLLEFSFG